MNTKVLNITGGILIAAGILGFVLKVAGLLPFLGGGLLVALILGAPSIGAFALFAARSLPRPAGIDNDDIYHNSWTARGAAGFALGVLLTGFYVMIYLGDDIVLQSKTPATVTLAADGSITAVSGAGSDELRAACWQCPNKDNADEWWQGAKYTMLLPYNGGFEKLGATAIDSANAPADAQRELTTASIYVFHVRVGESSTLEFSIKDTLHHWATRNVYSILNPLAQLLTGRNATNWFFYGTLYTLGVVVFGVRMILKYRHNNYHIIRTISVMAFQLGFAYMLPNLLELFKQPGYYFSYFWPLKPEYFY